jgi:hypothetical protein
MKHYWSRVTGRWLSEDEQGRFHLDYEPQETRCGALLESDRFEKRREEKERIVRRALERWKSVARCKGA